MLYKLLQSIKKEENVTQISNPNKDKQEENYRSISLMDIDTKNLTYQDRIRYHIKKIIHHDQMEFF